MASPDKNSGRLRGEEGRCDQQEHRNVGRELHFLNQSFEKLRRATSAAKA
jgi:hypothetical protein